MIQFTKPRQGRRHRVHVWFNTQTMESSFGVQCNVTNGKWAHVAVDGNLYQVATREAAAAAAKAWSAANDNQPLTAAAAVIAA